MRLQASDRLGIASFVALFLTSFALGPLTEDQSYRSSAWVTILIVIALSIAGRRLRLPSAIIHLVQIVVAGVYVVTLGLGLGDRELPALQRLGTLFAGSIDHLRSEAAPMPAHPGVTVLFVTFIAVIAIVVDILAQTLGQTQWTIAALGTLYLIPALGPRTDTTLSSFVLMAIGYLVLLLVDGINGNHRWSRNLASDSASRHAADLATARVAAAIALPALLFTIVLGVAMPQLDSYRWGGSRGTGSGPIQLSDPSLDIRRNLNRSDDSVVMTYQTDQPGGVYLRQATLPVFDNNGFHISSMSVKSGSLPPPPGLTDTRVPERTTQVQIGDYRSEYLPLPYAPRSFEATGSWGFDATSLVVISTAPEGRSATRNLSYRVTSLDTTPDGATLSRATAGSPTDRNLTAAIPADLPNSIVDLTLRLTRDESSPALKAAAIQEFLRSSRFTYSTETLPGSGYTALENFLIRDRRGYCEQFATSMAVMARIAGIPSRVAVGFLPGEQNADGTWEVSRHDQHAWPELYFSGLGWVRFEPTPGSVTGDAPPWTVADPDDSPTSRPSSSRSSTRPSEEASSARPSSAPPSATPEDAQGGVALGRLAGWLGGLLGVLALAALPWLVRTRMRAARLRGEGDAHERVQAAWAEVRDTVRDVGRTWPRGSPRHIAQVVSEDLPADQRDTLAALAVVVERSRYARSLDDTPASYQTDVDALRHGLLAGADRRTRVKAALLPVSLWVNAGTRLSAWWRGRRSRRAS